jgi:Zn-dependent peptidase ImmA (M78 family)
MLTYLEKKLIDLVKTPSLKIDFKDTDESFAGKINTEIYDQFSREDIIILNKNLDEDSRTLILAHELGHFVAQHRDLKTKQEMLDYAKIRNKFNDEVEAWYKASILLRVVGAPLHLIKRALQYSNRGSIYTTIINNKIVIQ